MSFNSFSKDVTPDLLLGSWQCESVSIISSYDKISGWSEFIDAGHESIKLIYTKDASMKDHDDFMVFVLNDDFKVKESKSEFFEGEMLTATQEFIYVSNDQFKLVMDLFSPESYKSNSVALCTRINK